MRSTLARSSFAITLVMTLALAVAGPAVATHNGEQPPAGCRWIRGTDTPEDHTDDVYVCRKDTWIHHGGTRVGNLAGFEQGVFPTWDATQPTTATGAGGGGYYVTNSAAHQGVGAQDPRGSFVTRGTYTGVLDNLAVDLWAWVPPAHSLDLNLELVIGSETILAAAVVDVRNTVVGNFRRFRYSFTNLYEGLKQLGLPNENDTVHSVKLAANGVFIINDPTIFIYDATDAPSGVIFNHDALTSAYTQLDVTGG